MNAEWTKIQCENDISELLEKYGYFHDSCLTNVNVITGYTVNNNLSMCINYNSEIQIVIQRQTKVKKTIVLEFQSILAYNLNFDYNNADVILNVKLEMLDNKFLWSDMPEIAEKDILNGGITSNYIVAKTLRYKFLD